MVNNKLYLAASLDNDKRENIKRAKEILANKGFDVYVPMEHTLEHSWDWPNFEWGLQVFRNDVEAIKASRIVVVLNYGRTETTSGTTLEQGLAYAFDKLVILVEMTDNVQSLMVANARYATVKGLEGLESYDFEKLPKSRTNTEVK
jgi:nucleoside 2-deoxyribosyltransferase